MPTDLLRLAMSVGHGPPVLLVHGVGVGPESFAHTADLFAGRGHRAHVLDRTMAAGASLETQVDAAGALLSELGEGPAVWVGVSGGATLGVLAALRVPEALCAALVHEPLVGPVAPELHARIAERVGRLLDEPGDAASISFVRDLVGERTWADLPASARALVACEAGAVRAEAPVFAAFAPSPTDLAACRVPVAVTVGARSSPLRHAAVTAAATALRGTSMVIPGVGHLPQIDNPAAFVASILRSLAWLGALDRGALCGDPSEGGGR